MPFLPLSNGAVESPKDKKQKNKKEKKGKEKKNESQLLLNDAVSERESGKKSSKKRKKVSSSDEEDEEKSETSSDLVEPPDEGLKSKEKKNKNKNKKAKLEMEDGEEEEEEEVVKKEEDPNAISKFRISEPLRAKLKEKGIESLFPIQAMTFDIILDGSDLVGRARTGQGKTLAFVLPILESSTNGPAKASRKTGYGRSPSVLVLLPTRELASQVYADFEVYGGAMGLSSCCLYGGAPYQAQEIKLRRGVDIVVGTPGRIKDHIERGNIDLSQLKFCVLDEADEMLRMGFVEDVELILGKVEDGRKVQTLLFSATLPDWVKQISLKFLKPDKKTADLVGNEKMKASTSVRHIVLPCNSSARSQLIPDIIRCYSSGGRTIIFTEKKESASELAGLLPGARALHGDIQQSQREVTLSGFRSGKFMTLVATNVAARGLDINDVQLIIQCEPPRDVEAYIHRSGRTGRAGNTGVAVMLYDPRRSNISKIERESGVKFEHISAPQPDDIAKAVGGEAAEMITQVSASVIPAFKSAAEELLNNSGLSAVDLLAKALAKAVPSEVMDREMGDHQKRRILMVSDFFYPNFGGVENHIYYLSQCLLKLGHKVVVVTHAYGNRSGVRYMTGGLKVYYVPWKPFVMQNTFPTIYGLLPIIRTILIRERITIVHGHQAFSTLCHEALMHARTMGYKVVFTDHSLYGFADSGSIHMNKVLQFTLADVSQAICVSHTSKENTVLRSGLPPEKVFVIPNAVDTAMFKPAVERPSRSEIVIVVISRLVYRKGADLLVEVIPEVCRLYPNVRFLVGGDGPKRVRLEEMREKHSLQERVEMLGAVPHSQVRSVLISGHIFLNSSLTEAFCIAILEAASCGLLTVSTRVGGVPEVLPDDMIVLAEPDPSDMVHAIQKAISMLPKVDPQVMHNRMRKLYNWHDVARRTEIVYDRALKCPNQNLLDRLPRYLSCGAWAGKLFCLVMIVGFVLWQLLELWQPADDIEEVPDVTLPHFSDEETLQKTK